MNVGEIESFDSKLVEQYVNTLVEADETERALLVLDNLPAFYRDNYPKNLKTLRDQIIKARITASGYLQNSYDSTVTTEGALNCFNALPRFKLIEQEVKRYNEKKVAPHIVDMGPGEYPIPIALKAKGYQFSYKPIAMDQKAYKAAYELIKENLVETSSAPHIFCALEVIEHIPDTTDLATEMLSYCGVEPERIHLSTPLYTYDGSKKNWKKIAGQPHLRAYTPNEFFMEARSIFPGYNWEMYMGQIMSLRGISIQSPQEPRLTVT